MKVAPGKMITPNVRLVSLLGEGGMGSVWVADHLSLETQVAVKFVSKELLEEDESILTRFNREAALSAQIKSPHVVQIHDHGVMDDGTPFIVMELLEGETLAQRLTREGTLSLIDTRQLVTQTAKALAKAHKLEIVHRDIKPDNIFLVESEFDLFVKVLDFGIAKQRQTAGHAAVTSTGAMVGTPEFMSPEQVLSAKGVDHRSDLWALGVVTYLALTGRAPFSGETLGSLCVAIAAGEFAPVTQLRPRLPSGLILWFRKSLAIRPEDRWQSARDLAVGFGEALGPAPDSSVESQFSQVGSSGPGIDWSMEDSFDTGSGQQPSPIASKHTPEAVARTVADKGPPTFAGASVAASRTKSRWPRSAIGGLAVMGVLLGVIIGVLVLGVLDETTSPTEEGAAARGTLDGEPTGVTAPSAGPTGGASAAGGSGGATAEAAEGGAAPPDAGGAGTSASASSTKPIASSTRPRPSWPPKPKTSAPSPSSHASSPPPIPTKDRGF